MSRLPAASANTMGTALLTPGTTYYFSLHSSDPGTTGAGEFTGGGYARQSSQVVTWVGGSTSNASAMTVPNAGSTAAAYFGIWSAVSGGTFLVGGSLTSPVTAASIAVAANALTVPVS